MTTQTATVKATTFNGLALIGKGETRQEAKEDAKRQAKELGTLVRRFR